MGAFRESSEDGDETRSDHHVATDFAASDGRLDDLPESAEEAAQAVEDSATLERVTQIGWIAKSIVYTLMGITAVGIAQQDRATPVSDGEEASPSGSVALIAGAPLGRALLVVLSVGLLLYAAWRILSVVVIRGNDVSAWADRVGYTFSAIFYLVLAYSAGKAGVSGVDPKDSDTVESLSKSLLESTPGRWLLGLGGVVTIGVGLFFAIHKGLQRSFAKHLDGVDPEISNNESKRQLLLVAGVAGWVGRGVVTVLVGFFVLRSAYRFDPDDARGFDRALRQVAGTGVGSALVLACALGLIAYGVFCFFSHRFRSLGDPTSEATSS